MSNENTNVQNEATETNLSVHSDFSAPPERTETEPEKVIPMANYGLTDEQIKEAEQQAADDAAFLKELDEKYKDRNDYGDTQCIENTVDAVSEDGRINLMEPGSDIGGIKVDPDGGARMLEDMEKRVNESTLESGPAIDENKVREELKDIYDLPDADILTVVQILNRIQKGEKISVYNALPEKLQDLVRSAMLSNNIPVTMENRNLVARSLIEDILADIKSSEDFVEFSEALKEIAEIPSLMDFHAENCKETMEVKLIEAAEKYKETSPDVSERLTKISNAWKETYTFTRQHNLLDTSERARNRITKDIFNYNDFINEFDNAAAKSKYIINDIGLVTKSLKLYFKDEYVEDDYMAFTILLCKVVGDDFDTPDAVAFIYYSIKNIIALDFVGDKLLEFNEELIKNIRELLDRIDRIRQENIEKEQHSTRKPSKSERRRMQKAMAKK